MKKKIHITLKEALLEEPEGIDRFLKEITTLVDINKINEKRLRRYGILTCEVEPERIKELAKFNSIEAIAEDKEQRGI